MSKLTNVTMVLGLVLMTVAVVGVSTHSTREQEVSTLPAQSDEDMVFIPPMVSPATGKVIEIVEVPNETVYTDGPIAYVDYSVDKTFGDCVAVWYPDGRFTNCADTTEGWQTMFLREVPAGADYAKISHEWNDVFAPKNWR